ncbi:MAG TPA: TlpA disulfide reductase family protein [Terriglobales bacterium]|nr:TlpA disulfide reductase family protein [Terriglobales bacterium]
MLLRLTLALILSVPALSSADIISDVRSADARRDFRTADQLIREYRALRGVSPEMLEAVSWIARDALTARQYDKALSAARETHQLALKQMAATPLDSDAHLATALGAAIEVEAQVMAARGERAAAVEYLRRELKRYRTTSIATRIQKNINLLSLEGKAAPELAETTYLGPKPAPLAALKGKPVVLFFWAHWCPDCKIQGPILAQLQAEFKERGLTLVAPTQQYGYIGGGAEASPQAELGYIDQVRRMYYSSLAEVPVPVSSQNFSAYGCSTTPTLVLINRAGRVAYYHPGRMTYEELRPRIADLAR